MHKNFTFKPKSKKDNENIIIERKNKNGKKSIASLKKEIKIFNLIKNGKENKNNKHKIKDLEDKKGKGEKVEKKDKIKYEKKPKENKKNKNNKKDNKLKLKINKIFMKASFNVPKNSMEFLIGINNQSSYKLNNNKKNVKDENKYKIRKKEKIYHNLNAVNGVELINKLDMNLNKFLESNEFRDYDEAIEEDKRTFFEYYCQKIKKNQIIIYSFFIAEVTKPKPIKITLFFLTIDLYFLINGLFFSNSYISEIFNSNKKETFFSFIPRSIGRFVYCTLVGNIITHIIQLFFIEETQIKNIMIKNDDNFLALRFEMYEIIKSIIKRIRILTVINFIITLFSWYYISCLNNVYPNIRNEWIISSIFIILIMQILPFIFSFLETCLRFVSIKCESEKLFKLSLLFP